MTGPDTNDQRQSTGPRPGPRVALVSGFWGQNIGNAFFNVGGRWILDQVFGAGAVEFIQDQPAYRTFHNKHSGNPKNDFNLLRYLDVEYVVLQGPMLTTSFRAIWGDAFREYKKRGVRVILLGAALFRFTDAEVAAVREFLTEYPPALISTRDSYSYEAVQGLAPAVYDGIDSAFFVPRAYQPLRLTAPAYVVANFDRWPEPDVDLSAAGEGAAPKGDYVFDALGYTWSLRLPALQKWFSDQGKWQAYLGAALDYRTLPDRIGSYDVVRPCHRFNPHMGWKIYKRPNAVASDEPFTYFTVYANAALTLSDRVHGCVATLAYGNPAVLFTPSPRARLFERLGVGDVRVRPVRLDPEVLERERRRELDFVAEAVARA